MKEEINTPVCSPAKGRKGTGLVVLVFYVVLLMLNASALEESVSRMPFGAARSFWLEVLRPCAETSARLHLGWPRRMVETHLGNHLNRDTGR